MKKSNLMNYLIAFLCILALPTRGWTQEKEIQFPPDTLLQAAREIMTDARFCALITIDESGRPHVRTMDPFAPEDDMVVWFGTNSKSRKVTEIRNDPRVSLYYADAGGSGYVVIEGIAQLINDPEKKKKYWKDGWDKYYTDKDATYILIKVVPEKLNILSYKHEITGDPQTWRTQSLKFNKENEK